MVVIRLLLVALICFPSCHGWFLGDLVVPHFGARARPKCQKVGQQCKFDRHCCAGLECRMGEQDYNIGYFCHFRLVNEDYKEFTGGPSWKDYQEPRSETSEYEDPESPNVEELYRRNKELRRKLAELSLLRKRVKQQQLKDLKRRLEEAEIEVLKDEKKKYDEKIKQELKNLREKEEENTLLEMEKKEVNRTLLQHNQLSDTYIDI